MDILNQTHRFDNGLVLLFEEMAWSESLAIGICLPAGSIWEPERLGGIASLTCEMTNRGAGEFDNRSFLETMENLGVRSFENASKLYANFGASGLVDKWERTLELLALQIRAPRLPDDEFEACRQIQLQEIASNNDDPEHKTLLAFNSIFLPTPLGRPTIGTEETLLNLTAEDVHKFHQNVYRPNGTIVAIAGRLEWEKVKAKVEELFGDWTPRELSNIEQRESTRSTIHVPNDTAQTHILLGYNDIPCNDPDYLLSLCGVKALSGGMSSRLFTEVREKRGLCYSVSASHYSLERRGFVVCSCSTTTESAQRSLDVLVHEIDRLSVDPISSDELDRIKIRLKSSLVMQQESTARRVSAMIGDWQVFEKIVSLDETLRKVDSLNCQTLESYFTERSNRKFRLATSGSEPLQIPESRLF